MIRIVILLIIVGCGALGMYAGICWTVWSIQCCMPKRYPLARTPAEEAKAKRAFAISFVCGTIVALLGSLIA